MKALVLYRSFYGNTKQVAETIAREIGRIGHKATAQDVREKLPDLSGYGLIVVGSPTRIKRANGGARRALKRLRRRGFGDGLVAVFDTFGPVSNDPEELEKGRQWLYPGAVGALAEVAKDQGLRLHTESLRCEVVGIKGPLADSVAAETVSFTHAVVTAAGGSASSA